MLFDLDAEVHRNHIYSLKNAGNRPRFNSSIPQLHSPGSKIFFPGPLCLTLTLNAGTEKVLSFHKSTQTMDEDELRKKMKHTITETPKLLHKKLSGDNLNTQGESQRMLAVG